MSWFKRKPTQEQYIEATIKVATNLYLMTLPGAEDGTVELQFDLPDSRYRYMIFCLSTAFTAALIYDEKKLIHPPALMKGCLIFATWLATERPQDFFTESATRGDPASMANLYFMEFIKPWAQHPGLQKEGKHAEILDLIATMVHTKETNVASCPADLKRLSPLALEIDCRLPAMNAALVEMASKV